MTEQDYKNALDRLNNTVWTDDMETTAYVETLRDALSKQIGKKPLDIGNNWGVYCPSCSANDGTIYQIVGRIEDDKVNPMFHYCPDCGQKIIFKED